jgi:protein transport protein SEC61 subunit alpha
MVLHTLAGTKYMMVQFGSKNERELFQATQKLFAFLITLVQALLCVFSGMYGPVEYLGIVNGTLIVLQLCVAGVLIILLDELLQKGYGLGNGIGLFTATNICGQVVWECISFTSITSPQGNAEFEGAIVFFFHQIIKMRWEGVLDAFVRSYGPNLLNLVNTLIVTVAINWYQVSNDSGAPPVYCDEILAVLFAGTLASASAPSAT